MSSLTNNVERLAARMICVGFEGTTVPPTLRELIHRGVRSVILFTRNYESPAQLTSLCHEIKSLRSLESDPVLICIDQEGGRVQRLREPFTIIPSMREIGRTNDPQLGRAIGELQARELRAVNIDMNLAPVLDVDSNPANPVIGERSFSRDPDRVATLGAAMIAGLQASADPIAACGKHFPGHGDTSIDSHLDLPRIGHTIDRLERVELPPFRAAIEANVAAIMTAHIVIESIDPDLPATISDRIITGILRRQLNFDRVIISDDLEMNAIANHFGIERAVVRGTLAGVDLFPICHQPQRQHQAIDGLIDAVERTEISIQQLERANQRLDRLFQQFVKPPQVWSQSTAEIIGCPKHQAIVERVRNRAPLVESVHQSSIVNRES